MDVVIAALPASIAALASVICALLARETRKKQEAAAKDAKDYRSQREKLDTAKSKVMLSTLEGVTVLLHQAKGEKLNGNVEAALIDIREAGKELEEVRSEIVATHV